MRPDGLDVPTVRRLSPFGGWLRRISRAGAPYLDRYSLREQNPTAGGGWRAYLHQFHASDADGFHNHPWRWAFSLVLRGGYTETRPGRARRWRGPLSIGILTGDTFHRVEDPVTDGKGTWTLFVCGPLHGDSWGFLGRKWERRV